MDEPDRKDEIVTLLKELLEAAEGGHITGLYVVTETPKRGVGSGYVINDLHRGIGGLVRLQARLLDVNEEDDSMDSQGVN